MQRTESEILEFKESFGEWLEMIQALCGFANKNGGASNACLRLHQALLSQNKKSGIGN